MSLTSSAAQCERCRAVFPIPNRLPRNMLNQLAITHADGRKALFIEQVRDAMDVSLEEAKNLSFHVTHDARCHWCGDPIPVTAIATCRCGATNVDLALVE